MRYVKAAELSEFNNENKKKITVDDKEILLAKVNDSFFATDNKCPHMGGSLYDGELEGSNIVCPRHGSVFDVTSGKVVESGKLLFIKVKVHELKTYPVRIDGADILIGIG